MVTRRGDRFSGNRRLGQHVRACDGLSCRQWSSASMARKNLIEITVAVLEYRFGRKVDRIGCLGRIGLRLICGCRSAFRVILSQPESVTARALRLLANQFWLDTSKRLFARGTDCFQSWLRLFSGKHDSARSGKLIPRRPLGNIIGTRQP